jgi:K+-sensing histidine kinase KdpD
MKVDVKNAPRFRRMNRLPTSGGAPVIGTAVGLATVVAASAVLVPVRAHVTRASPALVLVLAVVAAGLVGGSVAAVLTAVGAAAAYNLAFIPPYWTFKVNVADDWVALGVFLAVALVVGLLMAAQSERRRIVEQREAEARALYEQLQSIDEERQRLAEEASRAQVLERVDEQRSALLRSVSHDLRTPLASIRAIASDLSDGAVYDEGTRTELLATVCDEAERLDRIVANLLSLSRIETGALTPDRQAVALDELVADRVRRLDALFQQVRVQVDIPPDLPLVDGDYTQLDQVVTNLLENAARHAPPASLVRVTARPLDGMVEVRVADEGIGVPDWERRRIFEPFRTSEGSRSSGVGLAICKAIVEAHDGTIEVDRTPGGGATFVVTLPVRTARPVKQ